eukprot:TRINITY_DN1679_c0_g1_i1.p1 TRINITY_DN1679_c0_g1~~TRINITY_DN1679_c0_g1_i1.p1  ORF type:complete len:420 (-),score=87.28 TRINITY_DN1679_c0_g1_i1:323-1582(-)
MRAQALLLLLLVLAVAGLARAYETPCTGHPDEEPPFPFAYTHGDYGVPYDAGAPLNASTLMPEAYRASMAQLVELYRGKVLDNAPPGWPSEYGEWVYYGAAGRALMFLRLWRYHTFTADIDLAAADLKIARSYIDQALTAVVTDRKNIAFLKGRSGVVAIAAAIYATQGETDSANAFITELEDAFRAVTPESQSSFDLGIAGLLYCARFVDSFFGKQVGPQQRRSLTVPHHKMVARELVTSAAWTLFNQGVPQTAPEGAILWPDDSRNSKYYIGHGMGAGGIYRELVLVPEVIQNQTVRGALKATADLFLTRQTHRCDTCYTETNLFLFLSGQVLETQTVFIKCPMCKTQWCHGAPGAIPVFALAATLFPERAEIYNNAAQQAANWTFEHGVLKKGMQLCHGVLGISISPMLLPLIHAR